MNNTYIPSNNCGEWNLVLPCLYYVALAIVPCPSLPYNDLQSSAGLTSQSQFWCSSIKDRLRRLLGKKFPCITQYHSWLCSTLHMTYYDSDMNYTFSVTRHVE